MNSIIVNSIGYLALVVNLYSMSVNKEFKLRLLSLIANAIYIVYGVLIKASPVIIGCTIAVFLHGYHLRRLHITKSI